MIPDPLERLQIRQEMLMEKFVDENTCMECGKTYDYEMYCMSPLGDGPILCVECIGFDPAEEAENGNV